MMKLNELYIEEFEPLHALDQRFWSYDDDTLMSFPMMFITKDDIIHMAKNGGNPLGLKVEDGPLLSKLFSFRLSLSSILYTIMEY